MYDGKKKKKKKKSKEKTNALKANRNKPYHIAKFFHKDLF